MLGNQLGLGPGVRIAVDVGAASVDHCAHLTDQDIEMLAGSSTVATLRPRVILRPVSRRPRAAP